MTVILSILTVVLALHVIHLEHQSPPAAPTAPPRPARRRPAIETTATGPWPATWPTQARYPLPQHRQPTLPAGGGQ